MFNLGRILTGLATFAAVLTGAALGVPALMNWEHLREPVQARAGELLGVPVRVDGRITLQLLPSPALSLGDVVIEPASGAPVSGDFARARVHLAAGPLLAGKAVPVALGFSGAELLVDRDAIADGRAFRRPPLPLTLKDGRLRFEAGRGAADIAALSFRLWSRRDGGTQMRLSGVFEETPFSARAVWGGEGAEALRTAALDFGEGQARLSLVRTAAEKGAEIRLKLVRGGKFAAFLERFLPVAGRMVTPEQMAGLGPLSLTMRAVPGEDGTVLEGLEVIAGPLRLTGDGRFRAGTRPGLDLELGARTLVLGDGGVFDPSGLLRVLGYAAEWGEHLNGGLRLHADHVLVGGTSMRESEIRLRFGLDGTRLERFRTVLGGGLILSGQGFAAGPGQLGAAVRLDGARMRNVLAALPVEKSSASDAGDTPLTAEGRLVLSGTRAVLSDARIAAGRNVVRGEGALFLGERPALELRAETGELDLRPYGLKLEGAGEKFSANGLMARLEALAKRADITLRLELGSVRLNDATVQDGVLDLAVDRDQLVLRRLSIEEKGRHRIEARLRMPLGETGEEKGGPAADWTKRAEAAIGVRAADGAGGTAWRAGLWDGVLSVETETPVRSRLSGTLSRKSESFHLADLKGRIGKASVSGELILTPGSRPVLRGAVSTARAAIRFAGGADGELWPVWALADYWPRGLDIRLDWSANALELAGAPLAGASGTAVLEKDKARLVLSSGKLYGGAASGTATLSLSPDGVAEWAAEAVVQGTNLAVIMGGGWNGQGLIRLSASGSGKSIAEIVTGLRGTLGLNFSEGRIGGFDAAALAAEMPKLEGDEVKGAVERAFGSGATAFRRLEGEARISNGELTLSGISAQTESGPVMLAGVVSLPARLIAARADISLGDKAGAPLSVQFIGRLEAPERRVDTERLVTRLGE